MFESLVSGILNSILNTYIDDIDSDQVGASIYSGKLSLYNLSLKSSLFDDSPLPFSLEYGNVGRIYIKIPFWDMFKSPLQIEIEDVFGLVSIKKMEDWNEETIKKAIQDSAQVTLQNYEVFLKNQAALKDVQNQGSYSVAEKLVNRIIDNLEISIKNVYFRFEDSLTNIKSEASHKKIDTKFCFGLKLKEFKIFSADENFEKAKEAIDITRKNIIEEKDKLVYKVIKLDGFSLFCDYIDIDNPAKGAFEHAKIIAEERATNALDKASKKNKYLTSYLENEFSDSPSFEHSNIIDNFTIQINAQLNKDPRNPTFPYSKDYPQYKVRMIIDSTKSIFLYQPQIIRLLKTLELIGVFNEFKDGVLGDFLKQTLDEDFTKSYLEIYKLWKELFNIEKRSKIQEKDFKKKSGELQIIENLVYYPKIIDLRKAVCKEMQVLGEKQKKLDEIEEKIKKEIGIEIGYGLMMSWKKQKEIEDRIRLKYQVEIDIINNNFGYEEVEITDQMKELMDDFANEDQQLATSLDTEGTQADEVYDVNYHNLDQFGEDFVLMDIQMDMKTFGFTLQNEFSQNLFHLNFINYYFRMKQTKMSMVVDLKQQEVVMQDLWTGSKVYPNLIETTVNALNNEDDDDLENDFKDAYDESDNVMEIKFEKNEKFEQCPFHVDMNFHKPLQIVVNFPLINEIQRTINEAMGKEKIDVDYYINLATGRINELRDQAKEIADQAIKGETQHANCSIKAKYNAPLLIVPDSIFSEQRKCLRINLGQISINSDLQVYDKAKEYYKMINPKELYDDYTIDFKGLTVELLQYGQNSLPQRTSIVHKIYMKILIKNCLEPLHKEFPSMIADLDFPETILMTMGPSITENLKGILDTVMLQMVQLEYNIIGAKKKKEILDSNRAHIEHHKAENKQLQLSINDLLKQKIFIKMKERKKATKQNRRDAFISRKQKTKADGDMNEEMNISVKMVDAEDGDEWQDPDDELDDDLFATPKGSCESHKEITEEQIQAEEERLKKALEVAAMKKSTTDMQVIMLLRDFHIKLGEDITKEGPEQFGVSFRMKDLYMDVGLKDNGNQTKVKMSIYSIEIAENKEGNEEFLDKIMFTNQKIVKSTKRNAMQQMLSKHLIKDFTQKFQEKKLQENVLEIDVNIQADQEESETHGSIQRQVMSVDLNLKKSIFHMNMNFMARFIHKIGVLSKELEGQADEMVRKQDQIYSVIAEVLSENQGSLQTPIYSREYLDKLYNNLAIYHQKVLYDKKELIQFKFDYKLLIEKLQKDAQFTQTKEIEVKDDSPKEKQIDSSTHKEEETGNEVGPVENKDQEQLVSFFYFKSHYFNMDIKKIQVKIERFEFWLSDYNQDNINDIAYIMKFKFGMEVGLDQETLFKNLVCDLKKYDSSKIEDKDEIKAENMPVQASELITRTMKSEQKITVEIKEMAIENQVYESWTKCLKHLDEMYISQNKAKDEPQEKLTVSSLGALFKKPDAGEAKKEDHQPPVSFLMEKCDITVKMNTSSEYFMQAKGQKEVTMPAIILVMDYKDLSFLYFLSKRYEQLIVPQMAEFQDQINEKLEAAKEATKKRMRNMITDDKEPKQDDIKNEQESKDELDDEGQKQKLTEKLNDEINERFKDQRKKFNAEFKVGEEVLKEDEETFLLTTDLTELTIEKFKLQFSDANLSNYIGDDETDSTTLIEFFQNNLHVRMESYDNKAEAGRSNTKENQQLLDSFNQFQQSKIVAKNHGTKAFLNLTASFKFDATYFNQVTQDFEPFIEPWGLNVKVKQWYENDAHRIQVDSQDEFKFTASYGMAISLKNIQAQTEQQFYSIDRIIAKMQDGKKIKEGCIRAALIEEVEEDNDQEQENSSIDEAKILKTMTSKPLLSQNLRKRVSLLKSTTDITDHNKTSLKKPQTFKFVSNLQCEMVLCKSDTQLDENLRKGGDDKHLIKFTSKKEPALQYAVKPENYFEEKVQNFSYLEDNLKMIDVKFEGFEKVERIPIDANGIYSYQTKKCTHDTVLEEMSRTQTFVQSLSRNKKVLENELKFLLRVTSIGTQRIIYFESQLTFSNNQEYPLTLQFNFINNYVAPLATDINEFDVNDQMKVEKVEIQPMDIFNMPLAWFQLKDEPIDVYVHCKDKENKPANYFDQMPEKKELLFKNINKEFCKSASMTEWELLEFNRVNQTKIVELNDDFYSSVDIYGYKCFPKAHQDKNPLQFYISLNPPLTILNSSMIPLTLFEIDNPETNPEQKETSKIAPSCTKNIIELDTSIKNKSHIKLQFKDNDNNQFISKTLTQFSHPSNKKQSLEEVQYFKFIRHESQENKINIMQDEQKNPENIDYSSHLNFIFARVENFVAGVENSDLRENLIEQSSGINLEIYPSHILVNKSKHAILNLDQKISAKSSAILGLKRNQRYLELSAEGYKKSECLIDLTQIGIKGILTMNSEKAESRSQLQFGVFTSLAPAPYDNTLVVTIVPRYMVVNNMDKLVVIQQSAGTSFKRGKLDAKNKSFNLENFFEEIDCNTESNPGNNTKEIHLDNLIKGAKGSVMEKLIFRLQNEDEKISMSSQLGSATEKEISAIVDSWSKPFSVEEIDDFQTQVQTSNESHFQIQHASEKAKDQVKEWYLPSSLNNYNRIVRVLVTPNSAENDASLIIAFQNPLHKRYVIKNNTEYDIYFRKYDYKNKIELDKDPFIIPRKQRKMDKELNEEVDVIEERIFAWDYREITDHYIQILDDEQKLKQVISLNLESKRDKVSNELKKFKLFKKKYEIADVQKMVSIKFGCEIQQNEGTKEITVTCKRQDQQKIKLPSLNISSQTYKQMKKTKKITDRQKTQLEKREDQIAEAGYSSSDDEIYDEIEGKTSGIIFDLNLKGMSFSIIDNEPQELMNITVSEMELSYVKLTHKGEGNDYDETKENVNFKLGNFQIDNLINEEMPVMFASQKLFVKQLLQKKLDNKNGELHKEYNDFAVENMEYNKKLQEDEVNDEDQKLQKLLNENKMPFFQFEMAKSEKTKEKMKGSIVRYKKLHFAMQEFFYSIETQIIIKLLNFSKNLGRIMDPANASSQQREQSKIKQNLKWDETNKQKIYEVCPFIDATKGIVIEDDLTNQDRISFGIIMLGSVKCSLSVKLMNAKLSDFGVQAGGMVNILLPIFSSLASLKDCKIFFNELIITEGFVTQEMLMNSVYQHYYYQVQKTILRILGSSQMLGNPSNLVGKVGTGFYELARDPLVGMAQGPGEFAKGLKKGVQAGVKGIIAGGAESAGQASGAMYSAIANASGLGDTKNQNEVTSLRQGIGNGAFGAAQELKKGTVAFFVKPVEGAKRAGIRGFFGGIKSGTGAALAGPLAAATRGAESVSKGVEVSATNFGNHGKTQLQIFNPKLFRVRPSRRINMKGQIKGLENYDLLLIQSYLKELEFDSKDKFKYQQIKWHCCIPQIDDKGLEIPEQINVIVITQEYLLLFEVVNFVDLRKATSLRRRLLHECILLNQIAKYSLHKSNDGLSTVLSIVRSTTTKNKVKSIETHQANSLPITRVNGQNFQKPKKLKQGEELSSLPESLASCSKMYGIPAIKMDSEQKLFEKYMKSKRIQKLCRGEKKQTILIGDSSRYHDALTEVTMCLQSIEFITETVQVVQMYEENINVNFQQQKEMQ